MRKLLLVLPFVFGLFLIYSFFSVLRNFRVVLAAPGQVVRYVSPGGIDGGNDCTLLANPCATVQHAIDQAIDGDQILVAAGTYTENLTNDKTLVITGAGNTATTIDGGNITRVVDNTGSLAISDLTLAHGLLTGIFKYGAGIQNSGALTLTDVDIRDNESWDDGGGIFNTGSVFAVRVAIVNNIGTQGGAISNLGALTLFDSNLSYNTASNSATGQPAGGAIENRLNGTVLISNTLILSNTSPYNAGTAIHNQGEMRIFSSDISWNSGFGLNSRGAIFSETPILISDSIITHNAADRFPGINTINSVLTLTNSIVAFNTATSEYGASISASGRTTIINSAVISNTSDEYGGGIAQFQGSLVVVNSEISGNQGGGIYLDSATALLNNATVTGNQDFGLDGGTITVTNSIVANAPSVNCQNTTVISIGHNIEDQAACGFNGSGDLENTDPLLAALNSASTIWFHELQNTSPAIDHGNPANCPAEDIRGLARPVDGDLDGSAICDAGALEFVPPLLNIEGPSSGAIDTPYLFKATSSYLGLTLPITYTWEATGYAPIIHTGGFSDTVTYAWSTPGTSWITVTVMDALAVSETDSHAISVGHLVYMPALFKPHVPNAGYWNTTEGHLYVTEDNASVDDFAIVFYVPNCGTVIVRTTSLIPIHNNAFSFDGSGIYVGSGVFDSMSTAYGDVELNNLYIPQCGLTWSIPNTSWTGTHGLFDELLTTLVRPAQIPAATVDFMVELAGE